MFVEPSKIHIVLYVFVHIVNRIFGLVSKVRDISFVCGGIWGAKSGKDLEKMYGKEYCDAWKNRSCGRNERGYTA